MFIYSQQQPLCTFSCAVSKIILKILELGIHIDVHIHLVKQQNEHSPFITTLIISFQSLTLEATLHVIFFPSAAVALWIINVAGSLGLMLNCPLKAGNNVTAPDAVLVPIMLLVSISQDTRVSDSPDKVKSHSKRNSEELPSKTLNVIRTEVSVLLSGPCCGAGRVHVMFASTAQRNSPVNTTYSGDRLNV